MHSVGVGQRSTANRASSNGPKTSQVRQSRVQGSHRELVSVLIAELRFYKDWSKPGFRAMAMYRFGVWAKTFPRSTMLRRIWGILLDRAYLAAHRFVRNHHGIELHRSTRLGQEVRIAHQGGIVIHKYAVIGDRCLIHQNVTLGNAGRGVTRELAPIIGNDVELGVGVVVLGRVTIGDGARIGANVVVYTNVPPQATLVSTSPRLLYAPSARATSRTEHEKKPSQ